MQVDLKELLDKIYELEGLVHLALKREEDADDFLRLISQKGIEVGEVCKKLKANSLSIDKEDSSLSSSFILEEYSLEEDSDLADSIVLPSELEVNVEDEKNPDNLDEQINFKRGKLVFSINERYRFKRELFNNSDADFNNTLVLVASMENFDEAEDYFLNEESFDPANPVVKEFLAIIKKYFK